MKKDKKEVLNNKKEFSKKEMISFLYKTKNKAKENNETFYNMRLENYTNKNNPSYTYGIR